MSDIVSTGLIVFLYSSSEKVTEYNRRIRAVKVALGITTDKYEDETDPERMRNNLLGKN